MERRARPIYAIVTLALLTGALPGGCSGRVDVQDGVGTTATSGVGGGAANSASASSGTGGTGAAGSGAGGSGGAAPSSSGAGGADGGGDFCAAKCGPVELCDEAHLGLDDNCDGKVDEGCACDPGSVHWCFKGDPSYRHAPGCFDGTAICTAQGTWGDCVGGVHATSPDDCFATNTTACHAITASPYATVDLHPGTGKFSSDAVPGSETYTVACPEGVSRCPDVAAPHSFLPIQSGEYTVTYTKSVQGDPNPKACTFPLFVSAPGLRVELTWEHTSADFGVDLDLHVHQPVDTTPWSISPAAPQDCSWANCRFDESSPNPDAPDWFADPPAMPPTPVNWSPPANCPYPAPLGCHDPRLDADDVQCDFSVGNPTDPTFCAPENINVDYPPDHAWIRTGVHYYYNHGHTYDVHPSVKVLCDGAVAAILGPHAYYTPEAPVTFEASDGAGTGTGNRFWVAADVAFSVDACGNRFCKVQPIYEDASQRTPLFTLDGAATTSFAPPYPPAL